MTPLDADLDAVTLMDVVDVAAGVLDAVNAMDVTTVAKNLALLSGLAPSKHFLRKISCICSGHNTYE